MVSQNELGKYCLDDDYDQVYKMLQETYPNTFDAVAICECLIFINFRETEYYEKFVSEHKEDFEMQCLISESNVQNLEVGTEEKSEIEGTQEHCFNEL